MDGKLKEKNQEGNPAGEADPEESKDTGDMKVTFFSMPWWLINSRDDITVYVWMIIITPSRLWTKTWN